MYSMYVCYEDKDKAGQGQGQGQGQQHVLYVHYIITLITG